MMCSNLTVSQRVHRGAARLDETRPGWFRKLVGVNLDIKSCRYCVLGHVFGDFAIGMDALFHDESERGHQQLAMDHGFDTCHLWEIDVIHRLWMEEVAARLRPPLVATDQPASKDYVLAV